MLETSKIVRTMIDLKAIVFKSLYVWMVAYNCYHFPKFLKFLVMCSYFS
jgi:hypothetical protein